MTVPLKEGYKLEEKGEEKELEQKLGERYTRESENTF